MGTAQSEIKERRKGERGENRENEGGREPGFLNPRDPAPYFQNPDADSSVLSVNWASPPPPKNSLSQLPFPPKIEDDGSLFLEEQTMFFPLSSKATTAVPAVSEATTIDHHHGSTSLEPRNISQALVGATEHRRWRIEATQILGFRLVLSEIRLGLRYKVCSTLQDLHLYNFLQF